MLAVGRLWLEGLELRRVAARRIGVLEPSGRVGSVAAVGGKIKATQREEQTGDRAPNRSLTSVCFADMRRLQ